MVLVAAEGGCTEKAALVRVAVRVVVAMGRESLGAHPGKEVVARAGHRGRRTASNYSATKSFLHMPHG